MKDRKAPASLPTQEAELLDQAGFVENPLVAAVVMQQSKRELDAIMSPEGSLSMAEAQAALGVGASRLRQKLGAEKSLYGVKSGKSWRIPLFQFEPVKKGHKRTGARKLVRNIAKVLPSVDREASPLAVRRFFETENTDLVVGDDETPVTPLEWLGAGGAADVVAALAAEL